MVRIGDVARAADVSIATVSRALNGNPSVNPDLAERVREAAERLGYRPNHIARNLRRRRTDTIALVIGDVSAPFFTAIARGVEDAAQRNGYSVLLCNADEDPDKEARYLALIEREQVAGVILSPHSAAADVTGLERAGIPVVVVDRHLGHPVDAVLVESRDGTEALTDELLAEGWTAPGHIAGPAEAETSLLRLDGYLDAVRRHRIRPRWVHAGSYGADAAPVAVASLLDRDDPPDSLVIANQQLTLGVLGELARRGIRVGRDLGLAVFDDSPWAPFTDPPLTVAAQPAYEVGDRAAGLLLERLAGNGPDAPVEIVLPTELIVRESSRRR